MTCPKCGRSNPEDSQFCIYCANQLVGSEEIPAATGPTVLLDSTPNAPVPPNAPLAPALAKPAVPNGIIGAIWLIGLGILFMMKIIWPGVLILIGLSAYIHEAASGRSRAALRTLVFFVGLTLLFWSGRFFPGILILIGITALLSPEVRGGHA